MRLLVTSIFLTLSAPSQAGSVTVFAAASTTEAMQEIIEAFDARGDHDATVSFASSSTLAKQIENGAPAQVYIAANPKWMDYLAERDAIAADTRTDLLGNSLVLVAPVDSVLQTEIRKGMALASFLDDDRLAVGDPDHVPAGQYAKASLQHLGIWDAVEPRLARGKDVRAAMAYVERGETPLGITYRTDAAASKRVKVLDTFPADSHPPVIYPAAIVSDAAEDAAAVAFFNFLRGPDARVIFDRHGFSKP